MLKYADYDIVFQEVPDETTLALNLSNCPHRCEGCHSPQLRQDIGQPLTHEALDQLIQRYPYITCVALMGGDNDHNAVIEMAAYIHSLGFKSAWYTGSTTLPDDFPLVHFDYIKVGPYIAALGGLKSADTNQRFYRIDHTPSPSNPDPAPDLITPNSSAPTHLPTPTNSSTPTNFPAPTNFTPPDCLIDITSRFRQK